MRKAKHWSINSFSLRGLNNIKEDKVNCSLVDSFIHLYLPIHLFIPSSKLTDLDEFENNDFGIFSRIILHVILWLLRKVKVHVVYYHFNIYVYILVGMSQLVMIQ